jgi:hypothetical protein
LDSWTRNFLALSAGKQHLQDGDSVNLLEGDSLQERQETPGGVDTDVRPGIGLPARAKRKFLS